MANENPAADDADEKSEMPAVRATAADGAFDVAAPVIDIEDRSNYGSRFAHDEHHAAVPAVQPDGTAEIKANNLSQPWDLRRIGRIAGYAIVGAGVHRLVSRLTRRQRRTSIIGALGATAAVIGVGTWLVKRNA